MPPERKCKPCAQTTPYKKSKPRVQGKNTPKTSAVNAPKHAHSHLTLHDWLTVVAYHDNNQPITQQDVVKHFTNRAEGALVFTQSSLSHHLSAKGRQDDKEHLAPTPMALSSKKVRVVTRPDVKKSLFMWTKHMEEKREYITGPMLMAKREKFEEAMNVPPEERMKSDG
ncbi:hypothetical protein SERLA73DRAFT_151824 [Serpula lacrymans var. lacrymans S7.3]|uniref:Uncharacterized protein n=2 Tax=Serpula lacrymans var. lacrymans TaxID=341189 RepID=F8PT01_SERL3|nr:uncharacterized protein SERLADRAFT_436838 [Serpula lacrymans var. lacrymans S7.9]EGO01376.1 hypothetical protein SERLA73DRAFT_151824 [Serpula lacrymans var. lacrymans S7.3]EGO27008.1 hypothetical protein SERLADRAFT_436838 [Serpula lacrymans var. lacrymans S7.9]